MSVPSLHVESTDSMIAVLKTILIVNFRLFGFINIKNVFHC